MLCLGGFLDQTCVAPQVRALLKGQLVVSAEEADGSPVDATGAGLALQNAMLVLRILMVKRHALWLTGPGLRLMRRPCARRASAGRAGRAAVLRGPPGRDGVRAGRAGHAVGAHRAAGAVLVSSSH